jgi:hypothetical protein
MMSENGHPHLGEGEEGKDFVGYGLLKMTEKKTLSLEGEGRVRV